MAEEGPIQLPPETRAVEDTVRLAGEAGGGGEVRYTVRMYDAPRGPIFVIEEREGSLPLKWASVGIAVNLFSQLRNTSMQVFERRTVEGADRWAHIEAVVDDDGDKVWGRVEDGAETKLRVALSPPEVRPKAAQEPDRPGQYL